ncbi:hypothetical protein ACJMK2_038558, partial [Sinanodonta woodiana]
MSGMMSRCAHVTAIGSDISWEDLKEKQENQQCHSCRVNSANLWLCLVGRCHYVGCGESVVDHSSQHAEEYKHCLTVNLTTLRIWCYNCESEVYPEKNDPPFIIPERRAKPVPISGDSTNSSPRRSISGGEDSESDLDDEHIKARGLTGLQNLGNTCYMNAALQALSNCPPLTRFFLDCGGFVNTEKNPMLSRSYKKLISEMWHKKRPSYLVPSNVVNGVKVVHPMFRGYAQQDTQEFLRCFMDQLHEELKQPCMDHDADLDSKDNHMTVPALSAVSPVISEHQPSVDSMSTASSQSDGEYDTCDSGRSSDKNSYHGTDEVNERTRLTPKSVNNLSNSSPLAVHSPRLHSSEGGTQKSIGNLPGTKSSEIGTRIGSSNTEQSEEGCVGGDQVGDGSSGEYLDAVSETEPLCNPRSRRKVKSPPRTTPSEAERVRTGQRTLSTSSSSSVKPPVDTTAAKKTTSYRSVISDVFDGKILSSVQCLTCERVSTTNETFQDLSLPIPSKDHLHMIHSSQHAVATTVVVGSKGGACSEVHQTWLTWMLTWMKSWFLGPTITLQDCLAAFFSADELKGDNMYSCEKCKKLRNGIKYSKVMQLPEILTIHLKRFRHEFYSSKINTFVSFPLKNLDMRTYLHKDHNSKITSYDLIAVICHHGTAGGGSQVSSDHISVTNICGHYTAYCQNHLTEQWYEFDDQYVTEVDVSQVLNCEAYVLFYRKQNDHMISLRQKAIEMMEAREPSLMQFFVSKQWINRFNTFAEPGPITNEDFCCRHGGVPPQKLNCLDQLVQSFSQPLWEFLHGEFEGGPTCNHLFCCPTCSLELEQLRKRQKEEMETFVQLNEKFREEDNPSKIFAISMSWFKEWENFVRIKTDNPPGPIDNRGICVTRNKHDVLRPNSDYGQLSEEMWCYLYETYGGGPELVIQYSVPTATQNPTSQPAGLSSSSSNQMLNQSANAAVSSPRGVQSSLPQTGSMVPDEAEIQSTVNTEAQSKAEVE